jgi:polysaccharide pyruvyl transferase WcaK-like protein
VGLFGQGNFGNDASLEAVLNYVRSTHPDTILDARCSVPEVVATRYDLPSTPLYRYEPPHGRAERGSSRPLRALGLAAGIIVDTVRTATWVRRHDAVIVPGMGVLEQTVFLRAWRTPYLMFVLGVAGKLFGTDVVLLGVGASPIEDDAARVLIGAAARLASYRSFRDSVSKEAMGAMGVDVSRDRITPDVVFGVGTDGYGEAAASTVGVGVMDYSGGHGDRARGDELRAEYVAKTARFVAWLVANGRDVRVFTSDSADAPIVDAVVASVRHEHPDLTPAQLVAEPVTSVGELLRQTASVSVVVATRFHNVLFALRLGRPTIAVGYAAKHEDLMAQMGMARYCQPARALDLDRLLEQFAELERRAPELRRVLAERDATNAALVRSEFQELSPVLGAPSRTGPVTEYLTRALEPSMRRS